MDDNFGVSVTPLIWVCKSLCFRIKESFHLNQTFWVVHFSTTFDASFSVDLSTLLETPVDPFTGG